MTSAPRTLIADDQPDVLEALRLLLKSEGYQIEAANSPGAVLDKLQRDTFDLLLMDLNYTRDTTSGQEGLDLLARIQAIDSTLPVVAMTAWGSVELAVEAMRRGVRDFVLKPWDNSRLLYTLRSQIADGQSKRHELRLEREEVEDARAIGQALLPKMIPQMAGFDVSTTTQPFRSLSGDYFDVIELVEGKLALSIGDVIGKGVPAALLMSNVQASVRLLASEHTAPASLAEKVNRSVARNTTPGKFVTFFYCVVDVNSKKLTYTNAGHCAPILLRANGEVVRLEAGGAVLGVLPIGITSRPN
jgi:phosphoserine phosphatase RsbU/P